jgi:flavin-dependent dehydrogenase
MGSVSCTGSFQVTLVRGRAASKTPVDPPSTGCQRRLMSHLSAPDPGLMQLIRLNSNKGGRLCRAEIRGRDRWDLLIEQARRVISVQADFLIEAVGRKGSFSALSQRSRTFYDRLVAVMIPHVGPRADDGLLLLEAGQDGWWYSSHDDREATSLVYLTDADLLPPAPVARSQRLKDVYASTRLIQDLLGAAPDFQAHRVIDARTSWRTVIGDHGLAIGDAAFANDPLCGAGIRFALLSAEKASRTVAAFLHHDRSQLFEEYATWFASEVTSQLYSKQNVYGSVRSELHSSMFWNRRFDTFRMPTRKKANSTWPR